MAASISAQNTTQVEPRECYVARGYQSNLNFASAYSTAVYALARALQPSLAIFNKAMEAKRTSTDTNCFTAGILAGAFSLENKGSVLLNGLQAMSTLSLLAPMYWYPYSRLEDAECEYAKSRQLNQTAARPLECHQADAYDSTTLFETSYAWGLYAGVYVVLPFLIKSISRWTQGCCSGSGEEVPEIKTEPTTAPAAESAFTSGLNTATMQADKYSLIDVQQWTLVIAYLTPMIFFGLSYPAREKCNFALANHTH